jgi:FixJ family two-component response regulator
MAAHDGRVVCIVDDDASLRRSLRNLLTSVGLRVETYPSAEAFLESLHRDDVGCLVLDLRMAGMNGLDLLRHLAATGSRIPVIILTAHGDDEARRRSLQAGAVAFLEKPFQERYPSRRAAGGAGLRVTAVSRRGAAARADGSFAPTR